MAHANIYQVSLFPILPEDIMDQETIFATNDWFIGEIADYIDDVDRESALTERSQFARGFQIQENNDGKYIIVTSKEDYFRPIWEMFCKKMHSTIGLEEFMGYRSEDNNFGDYIYADGELMTFSQFIRSCVVNEPYYIGGVIGYHQ